jgi:hypothetical protein
VILVVHELRYLSQRLRINVSIINEIPVFWDGFTGLHNVDGESGSRIRRGMSDEKIAVK